MAITNGLLQFPCKPVWIQTKKNIHRISKNNYHQAFQTLEKYIKEICTSPLEFTWPPKEFQTTLEQKKKVIKEPESIFNNR